jgi:type I restriction enzyme S subunit
MKWERVELGEVFKGIPITRIETIWNGKIDPEKFGYAGIESPSGYEDSLLKKGDILMSHINSLKHLGKSASYKGSPNVLIHGMNLLRLRPKKEIILPQYAEYFFKSKQFHTQVLAISNQSVNQCSFSASKLKSLQIPLPPLPEQRRLAARLDKADAVRQKSRALVEAYAELGRSVFLEVFGDPVRNERGWEVVELKDVATINPRKNLDDIEPSSKVDFIGMANVSDISKQLIEVEQKLLSEVTKGYTFIPNQSVILAKITPCFENGKVAIADLDTVIGFGSTEFHVVIPRERTTKEFIKYVFMSESFLQKGVTQMTGSAGQKRIPTSFLKKIQIPLPPLPLQTRFAAMVANIEGQRRLAERQLAAAEAVFGGVLQGTFEG